MKEQSEMAQQRRLHTAEFKARVALEAIRGIKTSSELASEYGVHPVQISHWKKLALEGMTEIFSDKRKKAQEDDQDLKDRLYQQIGQLQVELEWLKKKSGLLGKG
jgi:transposase-like protein